jgi:glycosyltransferase involved in cell wall biosynthesis
LSERRAVFAIPGDLDAATGGYAYDRRMLAELGAAGWAVRHLPLGEGFPAPDPATLARACALLGEQPPGVPLLVDGLALGAMPGIGRVLGEGRTLVALVHHPLALEGGMPAARAAALHASERAALGAAARVVVTSRTTAGTLVRDYGVPEDRIVVAVPGTDPAPFARGSGGDGPLRLLSVGTLVPRKGHDLLLAALSALAGLPWRLTIAGDADRSPSTADALRRAVRDAGLSGRVTLAGAVSAARLETLYDEADLFVLASRHEGFGMAYAEAVARGLPVVGTSAGAVREAVPDGAGLLVPPDDLAALTGALRGLLGDPAARGARAAGARRAAASQVRWAASAALLASALRGPA